MANLTPGDIVLYSLDGYVEGIYRGKFPGVQINYDDGYDYVLLDSPGELEEFKELVENGQLRSFQETELGVVLIDGINHIIDPRRENQVIAKSEIDNFFCKEFTALLHGTNHIVNILKAGVIKIGDGSASGVRTGKVSTYPILDCDSGHFISKSCIRGKYFIFMDPRVLENAKYWSVTLLTDSAGGTAYNRYDVNTLILYFERVSKFRVNIWSDTKPSEKLFCGDHAESNTDYIGEVTIHNDVDLKDNILYIALPEDDISTIKEVSTSWPDIKLITYRDDMLPLRIPVAKSRTVADLPNEIALNIMEYADLKTLDILSKTHRLGTLIGTTEKLGSRMAYLQKLEDLRGRILSLPFTGEGQRGRRGAKISDIIDIVDRVAKFVLGPQTKKSYMGLVTDIKSVRVSWREDQIIPLLEYIATYRDHFADANTKKIFDGIMLPMVKSLENHLN